MNNFNFNTTNFPSSMGSVEAEIMSIVHDIEDHVRNCRDRIVTDGVVAPLSVDY